jgi:hypothetical protein
VKTGASWCLIDRRGRQIPTLQCKDSDPLKRKFEMLNVASTRSDRLLIAHYDRA